jgi:type VI secretion system protein VasG
MSQLNLLIQKLSAQSKNTLENAASICLQHQHYNIELEHWLLAVIRNEKEKASIIALLQTANVDMETLKKDLTRALEKHHRGNKQSPAISATVISLIKHAWSTASIEFNHNEISNFDMFLTLLTHTTLSQLTAAISNCFTKLDAEKVKQKIVQIYSDTGPENSPKPTSNEPKKDQTNPSLNKYAINLNNQAQLGKLDEVIARETEIQEALDVLCRRRQNNAMLIGDPGVGKTAIAEGLALRIYNEDVPKKLLGTHIYALDIGLLLAGASIKGEFEDRLKQVISEVTSSANPIILFIDEAHTLIGAGNIAGQGDAANLLKPAFARGEIRCIAATTWSEYKLHVEKDPALARRFQAVKINEPNVADSIDILRSIKSKLEKHHEVIILNEAIEHAAKLSDQYIYERKLPDKAISVLDTACSRTSGALTTTPLIMTKLTKKIGLLKTEINQYKIENKQGIIFSENELVQKEENLQLFTKKLKLLNKQWKEEKTLTKKIITAIKRKSNRGSMLSELKGQLLEIQGEQALTHPFVSKDSINEVVANWTGVPVESLSKSESQKLLNIQNELNNAVINQCGALSIIASTIKGSRLGVSSPDKPLGVFLLAGPSGVGKTQTAETLAELIFGAKENMISINLSEFKEAHKVSTLVGAPPGYVGYGEGGILTEAVRRKPYSLVLLDEVEKAHPSMQDIFYQIFDRGIIKDSQGNDISFKNTIIILTSNAASEYIVTHSKSQDYADLQKAVENELTGHFKPAFLARLTSLPYLPLSASGLKKIALAKLAQVQVRIKNRMNIDIIFHDSFIRKIIASCDQEFLGARQIDHYIQHKLLSKISDLYLLQLSSKTKKVSELAVSYNKSSGIRFDNKIKSTTDEDKKVAL